MNRSLLFTAPTHPAPAGGPNLADVARFTEPLDSTWPDAVVVNPYNGEIWRVSLYLADRQELTLISEREARRDSLMRVVEVGYRCRRIDRATTEGAAPKCARCRDTGRVPTASWLPSFYDPCPACMPRPAVQREADVAHA